MEQFTEGENTREDIKNKLRQNFDGKIVRKDLTKKIKEGANVPVYVLEFLLGQYCSSDDEEIIEEGVNSVKHMHLWYLSEISIRVWMCCRRLHTCIG